MANFTLTSVQAARPDEDELMEVLGPHLEELRQQLRDFRQATRSPQVTYDLEKKNGADAASGRPGAPGARI